MLDGIDVSSNNGTISWPQVYADGARYTLIKLTEGAGYLDPDFSANWSGARAAGLATGAYHFARPDLNTAAQEAQYFLAHLPALQPGDLVALDMEYPWDGRLDPFDYNSWALAWLQAVEKVLGFPPLLYSYPWYITNRLSNPALAHYPLWLADYVPSVPASIGVWPVVTLWQHSSTASYPGIYGQVDEDWISRTPAGLKALGKPAPHPTYLVLVDMMARTAPDAAAVKWPVQMVYKGATLDGTGLVQNGWVQVTAGGAAVWLLGSNLQQVS